MSSTVHGQSSTGLYPDPGSADPLAPMNARYEELMEAMKQVERAKQSLEEEISKRDEETLEELRRAKRNRKMFMEARARMAQHPVNQMMYSQPNVGYTQGAQSFSPMTNFDTVNQFHQSTMLNPAMTGNAVHGSSGAAGFDVNQLAQLFGSLGPEDRSRLGQFLTTRQGMKETSSKPGPNF